MTLKVSIILPRPSKSPVGGHKVVYQYANYLDGLGYDVTIYYESSGVGEGHQMLPLFVRRAVARRWVRAAPTWFPLSKAVKQKCIFSIEENTVDDGDVVIATAIGTAKGVAELPFSKGRKLYFIQGYEVWGDYSDEEVLESYRFGMSNIVISKWLQGIVSDACGTPPALIPDGIDRRVFDIDETVDRGAHTVAMLYSDNPCKGCEDAIAALYIAKDRLPDLRVKMFGTPVRPSNLPDWFEYVQSASQDQLHVLYNSAAALLCATVDEGFGLTGLEAMACGCALVSTGYQGVYEYADESCAMLSAPRDIDDLANNLVEVLTNQTLRDAMAKAGYARAGEFDFALSAEKFRSVVDGSDL